MDHLYKLLELAPGYPDTRVMACVNCEYYVEDPMEDAVVPVCDAVV